MADDRQQRIKDMRRKGMTWQGIADYFGTTTHAIRKGLDEHNDPWCYRPSVGRRYGKWENIVEPTRRELLPTLPALTCLRGHRSLFYKHDKENDRFREPFYGTIEHHV